jgi:hypothetical protein
MSYTINLTNGTTLIPGGLSDGTTDTSHTSLVLIGKDYAGYGQFLNENFVKLLENFASTSSPATPLKGQLWWDTVDNILKVWSGSTWKISTGATSSPASSPPGDLSSIGGDLWFDNTNSQLKVYTGSTWITVGPVSGTATGNSGAIPALMTDTLSQTHIVVQLIISGVVYAIFSKDTFTSTLPGFTNIVAGINFSTISSPVWKLSNQSTSVVGGTLIERDSLGGANVAALTATTISATTVAAANHTGTFTGTLNGNVNATTVSASTITATGVNATNISGTAQTAAQPNITSLGTLTGLAVTGTTTLTGPTNVTGTTTLTGTATYNGVEIATVGGTASFTAINNTPIGNTTPSTGAFTTLSATALSATGLVSVGSDIVPTANLVLNLGSPSYRFGNVWAQTFRGTSVSAQYADLAERFHSDAEYPAGTVVEMGGPNEITKVVAELSDKVFGVISTNAAYLMNSAAGDDATHPPIAMSGRVPVRAIGLIAKGDRLVSAGNGLARAGKPSELTPFNVIGRSLVNKTDANEGTIEAIVKINS